MANRFWFYAFQGQQQGPYPENLLRDLIARGMVRADTLVWPDGMAGWQKAGEIAELMSGADGTRDVPQSGATIMSYGGGRLSIYFGIWEFTWRSLLLLLGLILVVPRPGSSCGM
jgi:hypothetical protein